MKNKLTTALFVCAGIFTFICCAPETQKGTVYELALHRRALKIDSMRLHQQFIEIEKELEGLESGKNQQTEKAESSEKDSTEIIQYRILQKKLDSLKKRIDINQRHAEIVFARIKKVDPVDGPVLPEPAPPCPSEAECNLPKPESFLVGKDLKNFEITFFDENGKEFQGIEKIESEKISGFDNYVLGENFPENFTIKVEKISNNFQDKVEYELDMNVSEIPKK